MLSFIKNSYQMRIPMRKLFSSYVTGFDKEYLNPMIAKQSDHSIDSFEKILRVKDVVRSIMSSPSGSCLFSTITNKSSEQRQITYPVSFLTNYKIDFDGKPFFKINMKDNFILSQYVNMVKNPTSSMNVYSFVSDNHDPNGSTSFDPILNNLLLFGQVNEETDKSNINRLNWIYNQDEEDEKIKINSGLTKKLSKYEKYFKMDRIDQIELVVANSEIPISLENCVFNFIKPDSYLDEFTFNSVDILKYINQNYGKVIGKKINSNNEFNLTYNVDSISTVSINSRGIEIIYSYEYQNKTKCEKTLIDFSKKIKNFKNLYEELEKF